MFTKATKSEKISLLVRPPNYPMFLEPNHYYSGDPAFKIMQIVANSCAELGFDVVPDIDQTTFAIKVIARDEYGICCFWISVYTDDKNIEALAAGVDRFVIEFQRRSGEGFTFCHAVRGLKKEFDAHQLLLPQPKTSKRGWGEKARLAQEKRAKACADAQARAEARAGANANADAVHAPSPSVFSFPKHPTLEDDAFGPFRPATIPFRPATIADQRNAFPEPLPPFDAAAAAADSVAHVIMQAGSQFDDVRAQVIPSLAKLAKQQLAQHALLDGIPPVLAALDVQDEYREETSVFAADAITSLLNVSKLQKLHANVCWQAVVTCDCLL